MASQQQQSSGARPYMFYDYGQIRRQAARTPITEERDLEAEAELRKTIITQIGELEKLKSEMRKETVSSMTEMATKAMGAYASSLSALADIAQAQASTKSALAAVMNNIEGSYNDVQGVIGAGTPEESFTEGLKTNVNTVYGTMASAVMNPNDEMGPLVSELTAQAGSPAVVGNEESYQQLVDLLDQRFISGPSGAVVQFSNVLNNSSSPGFLAPNANQFLNDAGAAISSAVGQMPGLSPEAKDRLAHDLYVRAYAGTRSIVDQKDPNAFSSFAARQSEALQGIEDRKKEAARLMAVGVPPKLRDRILDNIDGVAGLLMSADPIAQGQVAADRLAKKGLTPPGPEASPEQKAAYEQAFAAELAATIPAEGFAQRMATLPVSPELDEQIGFLKEQLGEIGKTTPDALIVATEKLRGKVGDEAFEAWRRMTGKGTAEEAAVFAANNPQQWEVFNRARISNPTILTDPEQFRGVVRREAAQLARGARQEARAEAQSYATEGKGAPAPTTVPEPTPEEKAREAAARPAEAAYKKMFEGAMEEEPATDAMAEAARRMAEEPPPQVRMRDIVAAQAPAFQTATAAITAPRTQTFAPPPTPSPLQSQLSLMAGGAPTMPDMAVRATPPKGYDPTQALMAQYARRGTSR